MAHSRTSERHYSRTPAAAYANMYTPRAPRGLLLRIAVMAAAALLAAAQICPMTPESV
jgi:hypothetical protein